MPQPTPNPDEQHEAFIERCMLNPVMKDEFEVLPQRANACERQWKAKELSMTDLRTETITGVEVMRVGTWQGQGCPAGGCKITSEHLADMVKAHKATSDKLQIPVKLGHNKEQPLTKADGLPSAGWVHNLRLRGETLVADFKEVPGKIADLIRAGAYKQRSAELRENMAIDGTKYPHVLTAVALLGSQIPAVDSLDDIKATYGRAELDFLDEEGAGYSVFAAGDDDAKPDEFEPAQIDSMIDAFMDKIAGRIKGRVGAPVLRQLARALKEGIHRSLSGKRLTRERTDEINAILLAGDDGVDAKRAYLTVMLEAVRESGDVNGASEIQEAIMAFDEKALRAELGIGDDADLLEAVQAMRAKAGNVDPQTNARLSKVEEELNASNEKVTRMESAAALSVAEASADEAIRNVKIVPAQRGHIISQYLHDPEATAKFIEAAPKLIDLQTYGSEGDGGDFTSFEPTPGQIDIAKQMDNWPAARQGLMEANAAEKGVTIPETFFATKNN